MTTNNQHRMRRQTVSPLLSELMPALHFVLLFGCSSIAAWLLYGILSSTGVVTSKGFQLGGAAAGFVVIFWISHRILTSLFTQHADRIRTDTIARQQEKISELNDTITRLRSGELPPVVCPEGYAPIVSRDNGIALAWPSDWDPHQEKTVAAILRPLDEQIAELGFRGNIFVTSTPLDEKGIQLLESLKEGAEGKKLVDLTLQLPALHALQFFEGSEPAIEQFPIGKRMGVRCRSSYPRKGHPGRTNSFDCITVIDDQAMRFFVFALHECEELAEASREVFLKVVSSATFLG